MASETTAGPSMDLHSLTAWSCARHKPSIGPLQWTKNWAYSDTATTHISNNGKYLTCLWAPWN